ncbi:putative protein transport protein SEC7 [Plasmodium gaboni]|uniref:SEC7 domain-containing protein n=1 Tax=Plasmodium gaboni TaxID=647221 RepID=A0A151LAP4_9APIC|nr:putative protein transport protein SEC7 [Plasmodium gaboni]KYN96021.1 putative protein transport protein SEC7 [Plasmodium gaboni]
MEYKYYDKKMEKCISFNEAYDLNNDEKKVGTSCEDFLMNSSSYMNDDYLKLNIFTIIKNEIINVLSVIKKHEYNKNLDSSIVDALFILYNNINNLNNNLKEEIEIHDFNNKLDIYHIAPFLNIIRNNNIFYKIKLSALQSLDHILKYNSSYFNDKYSNEHLNRKQISYLCDDYDNEVRSNTSDHICKRDIINESIEKHWTKDFDDKHDGPLTKMLNEKVPKKKKYHFFSKNYKLHKKYHLEKEEAEENFTCVINKGNNIINISIETLLNAPINYHNMNYEEIILYDTMILFNNILMNSIKVVDKNNIIKIICYIFKIYKSTKYSLLFKGNCESILINIFHVVMKSYVNNIDDDFIHDILTIILILINNNKNKFVLDLLNKKDFINLYNELFENEMSHENLENINILSFSLLNILIEVYGYSLINKNFDSISNIIRCLFIHITSSSYVLICKALRSYINIFILYKKHFFIYNEIFINILLNTLKKGSSKNITETALLTLSHFCLENVLFEIYYNYDVNLYASDLLQNFIKSILELCVNFVHNTTIINEVIFKMIKNILYILVPYANHTKPKKNNDHHNHNISHHNHLNSLHLHSNDSYYNHISIHDMTHNTHDCGYINQLIIEFKNDIYSDTYNKVFGSRKRKRGRKRTSIIHEFNIKDKDKEDEHDNENKDEDHNKKHSINNNNNNNNSGNYYDNEGNLNQHIIDNRRRTSLSKKEAINEFIDRYNDNKNELKKKKHNLNELYSLNFLSSSTKDNRFVTFCALLLFEHFREYVKVKYIKKKKHIMRKKKRRKEILKKSATIFNTLKGKAVDELIKMRIIQTQETFNNIDSNYAIIDSEAMHKDDDIIEYSSSLYENRSFLTSENGFEKGSSIKSNSFNPNTHDNKTQMNNSNIDMNLSHNSYNPDEVENNRSLINNHSHFTTEESCDERNENEKDIKKKKHIKGHTSQKEREIAINDEDKVEENNNNNNNNDGNDVQVIKQENKMLNGIVDENTSRNDKKKKKKNSSNIHINVSDDHSVLNNNSKSSIGHYEKNDEGKKTDKNDNTENNIINNNNIDDDENINNNYTNEEISKKESDLHKMDNHQKKKKHHHHMTATEIISTVAHNFSKKHFKHSTKNNLMEDEYFVKSMAKFVRYNPFLDKEFVGEYISHRKNINLLKRYVRLFDFCNLSLLSSLRLFLRCFKLPGEAQLIERILEHFSLCFFYSNPIHGDLSNIYKVENDKVVCLVNDEELANKKRYILIDFLNENSNKNNVTHDDSVLQNGNESDPKKSVDKNNNENDSNINECSTNVKKHNVDNNENCVNDLHIEEKINLKKNVNINDYMHKNVYYLSKKIEGMSEEEIQKKYVLVENSDVIFILTYSIIMLNTDLHNNQVKNKMKLEEFIKNNRGINNGKNIDRIYLENLYNCILNEEIKLFSNTQNTYTNDDQYWKLLDQKKEEYKYYHSFKKNEIYFYKYDINKLLIRNNFLPIFFELFKRTNDYNLIEHCTFMFKMVINNLAYYHDLGNINKIGYIFKYINFYLTQKCQSLLYLFFHFIKKCYNSFRNCWSIYINIIFKLITIDLLPIFFYPHIFINNTQFNIDKDFLSRKSKKGNTLETYNINKSITETYQHPFLMFKKNVKKLNKSKWIDDFSSMFFSRHSTNENNNLSIIFKDSGNYNEKIEEIKNQIKEKEKEKKKKKKNDKVKDKVNGQENEHDNLNKNKKKNNEDIKHDDKENEKHSEEHHKADHNDIDEEDYDEDDDDDDIDDDDNDYDDDYEDDEYIDDDNDNYYNLNDNNNNDNNDELEYIYVNIKADPKNIDTSAIIDNVNIYKKLKLDIYNFFTFNDFHNNMITNLNISSFIYLIKILIIKCSIKKENEIHNVSAHHTNKAEVHHHSFLKSPTMSHNHNNNYLTNDKAGTTFNVNDYINDTNPIIVNSESSFEQFYHSKEKLLSTQMFFHIMCYKINYTYILYNMLCKLKLKSYRRINRFIEKGEVHELNLYMKQIHEERKCKNINHEERNKKNYFDLTLNNIYDTDNTSDAELSDSDYSDISNDSFFVKRKERILVDIYMHSHEGRGEKHRDERNRNINHIDHNHNHDDHFDNSKYVDEDDLYDHYYYNHHEHKHKRLHEEQNEEYDEYKEMYKEFDKIYSYADSTDEEREDGHDEEHSYEHAHHNHDEDEDSTYLSDDKEHADVFNSIYYSKHKGGHNVKGNFHITNDGNLNKNLKRSKQYLIDKIKMDLYMKTYIMHIKIIVFTFEHYFNLLNSYLLINYDSSIFINIYNSIFKNYKMNNVKVMTEEDISNDKSYNLYDTNFEDINKKINYKEEEEEEDEEKRININDIENNLFTVKMEKSETEEGDWLFIEQLIMSIMNFSYLCFNIYKENKVHISKKLLKKMNMNGDTVRRICLELQKRNKKFFFLCGIYLIYILQFLKKNILYRFIDKIIFVLEKISKNVYVNSCIINIYLNMLQLITPNNILYKNTNNTNISLNDKDIYIYIEKATIYTESINNIINNNNVLLKLNNFNIENIILSLLPYLLYFNNKKEEINSHIASINSECLHIISNIYYKSIYMYMNNNINHRDNDKHIKMKKNNTGLLLNSECDMEKHQGISYENIIELKKMYIFLLTCFVLSLACSFSSKRTRSEAYIKLQQFLFNESYIFKRVNKKEDNNNNNNNNSNNNNSNNNNNSSNKNSKEEKYVYRNEKLIDLISNFIILPLITYNYYFPFICKNKYRGISNDEDDGNMKHSDNEIKDSEPSSENLLTLDQNNYCKEALLNYNLFHKKNHVSNMSEEMWKNNEYENCGCIINYKNLENIDKDNLVLNNILNYANDYYIHTILHKQYNYYFSYLYAKKMLTYDNVCYRKSMSISFVSHIMLSFLYSLLNCSDDIYDDEKKQTNNLLNSELKNNKTKETHNNDEDKIFNLYSLLCLNNEAMYNKIVTKGKCESNCIYYFLKHFYHSLLTIKEEANKILNIYKETFIENMKNIIYVSSSYAYCLKDHRISCFSHIKNGYYFLREQEKNIYIKLHNVQNIHDKEYPQELDNDVVKNIKKLQLNVRISIVIVYYILYMDNNSNEQFKATFEELLNVLLTKYSDNEHVEKDEQKKENEVKEAQTNDDKEKTVVTSNNENNTGKKVDTVNLTNDKKEDNVKDLNEVKEDNVKDLNEVKEDNVKDLNEDKEDNVKDLNQDKEDNVKDLNQDKEDNIKDLTEKKVDDNLNISNKDEALEKPQALEEQEKQDVSHSYDEKDEKQN